MKNRKVELPLLAPHDDALQKCVYCPKLSRVACPVSNIEANETLTPWGKMSLAWFALRGDVPHDAPHAESAWACSACYGCRERCEHKNQVAGVLSDARAEHFAAGLAPAPAVRVAERFPALCDDNRRGVDAIDVDARKSARTALLIGCSYVRHNPAAARAIWRVVQALSDREVRAVRRCCGVPLLHAGDRPGMIRAAEALCDEVRDADLVIVADPGCARALLVDYTSRAVAPPRVVPLVDWLYARLDQLPPARLAGRRLRYADPCQLGRGLGRYDEPRAILGRITGEVPGEMPRRRELAECSGAGGILPVTRAETSRRIADERIAEHRDAGGGTLVTGCGESLRRYRSRGEPVQDLYGIVAEALGLEGDPPRDG